MNQEREPSDDPTHETDSRDTLERLAEIERRLKKAQPRPFRLDVAAIERLARETMMPEATERPTPAVTRRKWWTGSRWPDRRMAAIGASWAGGAIVGALVTFVLMSRTVPATHQTDETARLKQDAPPSPTHDQGAPSMADREIERRNEPLAHFRQKTPRDSDGAALAMILDPFWNEDLVYPQEGPTLRVGMHLRAGTLVSSRPQAQTAIEPAANDGRTDVVTQKRPKLYPDPAPATARGRLLHELLQTPGSVL